MEMLSAAVVSFLFLPTTLLSCSSLFGLAVKIVLVVLLKVCSLVFPNNVWRCSRTAQYTLDVDTCGKTDNTLCDQKWFSNLKNRPVTIIVTSIGVPFEKCSCGVTCGAPTGGALGRLQAFRALSAQTPAPLSPPVGIAPCYSITLYRSVALGF